jgi:hypothetical protein
MTRLWPYGSPFIPPRVERPLPKRRPSLLRRAWAWVRLLRVDAQLEDASRRAWGADRRAQLAEHDGLVNDADYWVGVADEIDGEVSRLKERQKELEGEVRG